jgi:hypothetical protein
MMGADGRADLEQYAREFFHCTLVEIEIAAASGAASNQVPGPEAKDSPAEGDAPAASTTSAAPEEQRAERRRESNQQRKAEKKFDNEPLWREIRANPKRAFEFVLGKPLVEQRGHKEPLALCPWHNDRYHPNLSLNFDKLLAYCNKCGKGCGIIDLAKDRWGLDYSGVMRKLEEFCGISRNGTKPKTRKLLRTIHYEICNLNGEVQARHIRQEYSDGSKDMPWDPPGVKTAELPLFQIEKTFDISDGEPVVVCEGEKAAASLWDRYKTLAVGTVTGAGGTPCDESLKPLLNHPLLLWPDNDQAGRDHMQRIGEHLQALGHDPQMLRTVVWPEAPGKGDAADFEGGVEALDALLDRAPVFDSNPPAPIRGRTDLPAAIENRWPRLLTFVESKALADEIADRKQIIENLLTVEDFSGVASKKGTGKSTFLRSLAVAVAKGQPFLGLTTNQCRVWYLDLEPGNQQKRHEAFELLGWNEHDKNLILTQSEPLAGKPGAFEWLEEQIVKNHFDLVIIDTLLKLCKVDQGNDYSSALYGTAPLEGVIKRTKSHIICAHHSPKNGNPNNPNATAADLFLGAVAIVGGMGVCLALRSMRGGTGGKRVSLFMDPPRYTDQVIEGEWLLNKNPVTGQVELDELVSRDWWKRAKEVVTELARRFNTNFSVADLLDRTEDYSRRELKRVLNALVDDGVLLDCGKKKRGGAVEYRNAGTAPQQQVLGD